MFALPVVLLYIRLWYNNQFKDYGFPPHFIALLHNIYKYTVNLISLFLLPPTIPPTFTNKATFPADGKLSVYLELQGA